MLIDVGTSDMTSSLWFMDTVGQITGYIKKRMLVGVRDGSWRAHMNLLSMYDRVPYYPTGPLNILRNDTDIVFKSAEKTFLR